MDTTATNQTTLRQRADGTWETLRPGVMWLVTVDHDKPHPAACGHPPDQSCLTVHARDIAGVFWSKEAARTFADRRYQITPDEWIEGSPDGDYDFVVRMWMNDAGQVREQFMLALFDVLLDPEPEDEHR